MTRYTRDDVQTHSDGFRDSHPAVNVKVYRGIQDAWKTYETQERTDPRFTLKWIEEHVSERVIDDVFWMCCEHEFEYLAGWAQGDEDSIFPADRYGKVTLEREGRSGGWVVVHGLPDIDEWDAVLLARWRKFERIARDIAADIPTQMLSSLEINEFERWADEQADESIANAELPVDQAFAGV